jgi:16S rRNA (cytidine1402-2'-O)-methyltransferase
VVLLEAPHRIESLARALAALGERRITVGRELTKQFEEIATVAASALPDWFAADRDRTRGEFALVLHPVAVSGDGGAEGERVLRLLLAELPVKTAVKLAAEISGAPRNTLYETALRIRNGADNDTDSELARQAPNSGGTACVSQTPFSAR